VSGVCQGSFGLWFKHCLFTLLSHVSGSAGAAKPFSGCMMLLLDKTTVSWPIARELVTHARGGVDLGSSEEASQKAYARVQAFGLGLSLTH